MQYSIQNHMATRWCHYLYYVYWVRDWMSTVNDLGCILNMLIKLWITYNNLAFHWFCIHWSQLKHTCHTINTNSHDSTWASSKNCMEGGRRRHCRWGKYCKESFCCRKFVIISEHWYGCLRQLTFNCALTKLIWTMKLLVGINSYSRLLKMDWSRLL